MLSQAASGFASAQLPRQISLAALRAKSPVDAKRLLSGSLIVITLVCCSLIDNRSAMAQVERGIGFHPRVWAITKARLVISPDKDIAAGTIVIRDGVIAAVGASITVPPEATLIDGTGLTVYPGFIDSGISAGLLSSPQPSTAEGRPIG